MNDNNCEEVDCDCDQLSDESNSSCISTKLKTKGVKRRKQVLNEDLYVDQIEKIIERDFFPDLAQIKNKNESQNNDFNEKIFVRRHAIESPKTFETPIRQNCFNEDNNQMNSSEDRDSNLNVGLDQFLNKYTSEDNASFEQIQEHEQRKHRLKYKWLYKDVNKHNNCVKQLLELPSIEKQAICESSDSRVAPITWSYSNCNSVMFNPSGVLPTEEERLANSKSQEVVHSNTRFERIPFNEKVNQMTICLAAQLNARQKEGKIGIDGKELVSKETPQINGFKFVASTPTPVPELYSESPFMTWGEIEATPLNLTNTDTPIHQSLTPGSSHFKIPELPERERIGLSLAIRAAKQHRDRKKRAIHTVQSALSTPYLRNSSKTAFETFNSMSPAAQRLATNKLGVHRNVDRTLMASYSPARNSLRTPEILTPKYLQNSPSTPIYKTSERNNAFKSDKKTRND